MLVAIPVSGYALREVLDKAVNKKPKKVFAIDFRARIAKRGKARRGPADDLRTVVTPGHHPASSAGY